MHEYTHLNQPPQGTEENEMKLSAKNGTVPSHLKVAKYKENNGEFTAEGERSDAEVAEGVLMAEGSRSSHQRRLKSLTKICVT